MKVRVALAGQRLYGIVIFTSTCRPAPSVPLDGVKVMPDIPLLEVDQFSLALTSPLLVNETKQFQAPWAGEQLLASRLLGLTDNVGARTFKVTCMADWLSPSVKVPWAVYVPTFP